MANDSVTFLNIDYHELTYVVALVALNLFMLWVLRRVSAGIELKEVVSEKDPSTVGARANAVEAAVMAHQAQAQIAADQPGDQPGQPQAPSIPDPVPTSYSRVAGVLGALVLVAALWGLANFAVWAAFWNPARLAVAMNAVGQFFLAGSALFAPYAFNQLGTLFRPR